MIFLIASCAFLFGIVQILELGDGWDLAFFNSKTEFKFIKQGHSTLSDRRYYWIGGSSAARNWRWVNFDAYDTAETGTYSSFP